MKKLLFAALLALPAFAASARADGCGCCWFPWRIDAGVNVHCRVYGPGDLAGGGQLGPWYQYWPLEAHFQTPAPTGYPYWPTPMTLPPGGAAGGAPAPGNFQPASYTPSGYGAPAPYYWSR